jgi:glycosyltransferase involved in cell wall biosynthesis
VRVAINAQIMPNSGAGGIETVLMALTALTQLDGPEEYFFIGPWERPDWLQPLLGSDKRIIRGPQPSTKTRWNSGPLQHLKPALEPLLPGAHKLKRLLSSPSASKARDGVPVSDGFYEQLGCDVIHFPFQSFVRCALPTVYNPHDLQHLYFPQFFARSELAWREALYPAACRAAHTVVVASSFVKQDLVGYYQLEPEKVQLIPWAAPPLQQAADYSASEAFIRLKAKYQLTDASFALYPAMTWEHKNHIRLLEALALLREKQGLKIHLICTGQQNKFWPTIEQRLFDLGLQEQVRFLGIIPYEELCALYDAAQFVIIPTLFESASAPLFEAWQHGVPVACSSVTSLPEQAAHAALLFDPFSVEEIALAVSQMASDEALRAELRRRGARRIRDFSLERTAKMYRAVYRRAAGHALSEEDRQLLNGESPRNSHKQVEVQYQ